MDLLKIPSIMELRQLHEGWINGALARGEQVRESNWTESVAIGSRDFVADIKNKLGVRVKGRRILATAGTAGETTLCEPQAGLEL